MAVDKDWSKCQDGSQEHLSLGQMYILGKR